MNNHELTVKVHSFMYRQCRSKGYATAVDVLMDIGVLQKDKYEDWRFGHIPYLERVCTINLSKLSTIVSSQVKRAKFRQKVYQCRGEVSPGSIPAEKLVSNGLVVLQSVAGAGHVNNLTAVDEAVEDSGGNGSVAKEVGPLVKPLVGSNDQ